jgi:hypothetical protein
MVMSLSSDDHAVVQQAREQGLSIVWIAQHDHTATRIAHGWGGSLC